MPNLRRSIQSKNNGGLSPTRIHASAKAAPPPRKVIKALYDYNPLQAQELSFTKGDFFHVVSNEDDPDWYEASNPVTGARGFVPVSYFQTLEKMGGQQQARQRNSGQSFEDSGSDSGTFIDPLPHQYRSQKPHTGQQHYHQPHVQHSQSFSSGGGPAPSAGAAAGALSSSATSPAMSHKSITSPSLPRCQPLYGIVLYDFGAERTDELDCKVGESILVIAQSNEEWYVAKPIGRLGGPGLIPVSFVEIKDPATGKVINVPEMLRQTGTMIPRVDEWKKQAMEYKANSIPLGRIDTNDGPQQPPPQPQPQPQPTLYSQPLQYQSRSPQTMPFQSQPIHLPQQSGGPSIQQLKNKLSRGDLKAPNLRDQPARRNPSQDLDIGRREGSSGRMPPIAARSYAHDHHSSPPLSRIVFASVESFHHEDGQYWFSVRIELASGMVRNLFRLYEDFYNFHIALLEEFPSESGRMGDQPRILPFMPVPLTVVTDEVSASRRTDLDAYVQDLCKLPSRITQHPLVENLFAVKDGDTEAGGRPVSPGLDRSSRSSPATQSARGGFTPRAQQNSPRNYGDESAPTTNASSGSRAQSQLPPSVLPTLSSSGEMIKVKISYMDDIMAMRIPVSITFNALQKKIFDRLQVDHSKGLSYRDERGDFALVQSDRDVCDAIDRTGGKLMIYVD